jgi:hypothetical protein
MAQTSRQLPVGRLGAGSAREPIGLGGGVAQLRRAPRHAKGGNSMSLIMRGVFGLVAIAIALIFLEQWRIQERSADRRAIEAREVAVLAPIRTPHSALACLDVAAGEVVEAACEKAVFASPESTAAAVEYVSARIVLLWDEDVYAKREAEAFQVSRFATRRSMERDRFGLYAQVLAARFGCDERTCAVFALLEDPERLKANLRERRFDALVQKYAATWSPNASPEVATATQPPPDAAREAISSASKPPVRRQIDYASSASIPAVSIMNPELRAPADPATLAPPRAKSAPQQKRGAAARRVPPPRQAPVAPAAQVDARETPSPPKE